eukprot:TRINITY_DN20414_c0_g1_i3.p1 TRINITY_DN20414_c0_g1~~TRINITY_DN20414_c0_g1_i3.p1  ORF type:complete len:157 (+),score=36.05 TRINITY_DN20414_c0_g1_i3:181-651(+)
MSSRMTAETFYDKFAATYDTAIFSDVIQDQHFLEGCKLFKKHIGTTTGSVLDIGCGTGLLKDELGPSFEYTGVDVSGEMLDRAAARGYKCIKSGAETALPLLPDNSVDYIVALSSLHFVEDFQMIDGATDDYKIRGWTSPTLGMDIQTRMIYIPLN